LVECVDGLESVIVGEASVRRARSLLTLSSSRDEDWLRLGRRRRRLAEFEDVQFEVPTPTSAPVESEAEPLTGSKQAADLFNKAADESSLTGVASALGIDVADLSFGDLAYFEGDEFTFSSDFDQAEDEGASTWATVLVAFILVTAMLLCSCCTCLVVKHATEKGMDGRRRRAAAAAAARSPPRKSAVMQERLSTIEEEQGLRVGKSEMTASHSMGPSPHHSLIRSTSQEAGAVTRPSSSGRPKSVHRTHSIGSETSSAVSEKFVYTNPMHKHEKKLSPPNEYGDDLAQHYEGEVGDMSDVSSELPHDKTDNPLFSSDSNRDGGGSSPTSVAEAARARGTGSRSMSGGGSGSGSGSRSGSGHLTESDATVEVDSYGASMSDAASTSLASSQSNTSESPLIDPAYSSSFDSDVDHHGGGEVAAEGSSLVGGRNPRGSGGVLSVTSETSSRMPFGLSPVAERTDSRGESPGLTTNSSSTTGGASTVYLTRAGADGPRGVPWSYGGPDGGGSYSMASGGAGAEDDDAESVFRPPSPGSVSRPLQPLLAQQSPMSCVSGFASKSNSFAMSSRSSSMASSFASPKAGGGAADAAAAASRLPAVGLRKGISNESLKAIKITSGGGDAEREAVREAVRRQRRKVARSLSQEDRRTEASSEGTAAMGEDELGSLGMDKIPRSSVSSLSPRARQRNEWRARYGSSQSELKFAEGGGGGGGGGGGSLAASSRMASGISDARLTSASTLSSFNGESIVSAMPSADARARSSGAARASPDSASAAGGGGVFGQSDTGSDASADAAAGHGDPSGSKGLASALDRRVKSAAVAPSPTHSRSGRAETGATKSESTVDEDGDEFYDATSTAGGGGGGGGGDGGGSVEEAAAARACAGRDSSRHAGGTAAAAATAATDARARDAETAAVVAAAEAAAAAATRTRAPQMMAGTRMSSSLSLSRSSSEASSLPSPVSIPSTSFQSHHAYMSGGGGSGGGGSSSGASSARAASAAAAAVAAAGVLDGTRGLDQASIVAAEECRDRAIEAGTAAAGAAVASGEVTTEAQLMAAGAVAAAKATKGRAVPDDVRRKAIQAGAAAAAAAAAADVGPPGGGVSNRWSTGTSAVELKSALKKETSFRSTAEKPRSVSFAYDSDGDDDDDDYDSDGDGSSTMGGLRQQHLADPSRPSGSYRRQESDSSSLSGESLSPSYRGSSATGGGDDVSQASFDTNSTFSAVSVSSYATATTTSTAYGGGRAGGGRGRDDAYSQRSSYSFRHDSSGSCSESDTDWPPSYQRGAGPLSSTIVAERKGEEEATGAHAATAGRRGGGRVLEDSAEAAAAAAAAITPRELGATTAGPAAAASASAGAKKESTVSAYKKMFTAGDSGGGSSRSSSGESKRRMVMR
ncbi:unnamed protein product, partial [Ectocarpus sp. 12 AP-2014]